MKKFSRSRILAMLIMLIMMFAVACGQTEEESADPNNQDVSTGQNEQSTDDVEEPGDDEEPADIDSPGNGVDSVDGDEPVTDALTVEGTFGGLADPHTFELKTDEAAEGVMAFQFYDEKIGEKLADMENGQELTVVYTTNEHGQHLVESIE